MKSLVVVVILLALVVCLFQGVLVTHYIFSQQEGGLKVEEGKKQQLELFIHGHPASISNQQKKNQPKPAILSQGLLNQGLPHRSIPRRNPPHKRPSRTTRSPPAGKKFPSLKSCSDGICSDYLGRGTLESYRFCESMAAQKTHVSPDKISKRCKFRNGKNLDPVALVSVPGSGNTWVRGLLEKATGICTGSIYCDESLRSGGFIGEYVKTSSVLVVKTHTSDFQWIYRGIEKRSILDTFYGSAILLIRNPFHTFVSERHRSILLERVDAKLLAEEKLHGAGLVTIDDSSHVKQVGREEFGNSTGWEQFVSAISARWQKTILKWTLSADPGSLIVVRYEDIKRDSIREVKRMLDFLQEEYVDSKLSAALRGGYSEFKRNHSGWEGAGFQYYSLKQKDEINTMILETIKILKANKLDHLFKIEQYLM